MPMPKPACGTVPYVRTSRYHLKASSGRPCSSIRRSSSAQVVDAHAAADDLAVSFRCDHVHAQRARGVVRVGLHVERFHVGGIVRDHHRTVASLGEDRLVGRAEVVARLERRRARGLGLRPRLGRREDPAGLVVAQAGERLLHALELGRSRSRRSSSSRRRSRTRPIDVHDQVLGQLEQLGQPAQAISGSIIQNSERCRRVLDFSARNVGPKQ